MFAAWPMLRRRNGDAEVLFSSLYRRGTVQSGSGPGIIATLTPNARPDGGWALPATKIIAAEFTGGCQCGAVRFRTSMLPSDVSYCHCRMCQRAVGNLFATLAMVRKDRTEWTTGEPAVFASSTVAERGFCRACGTPLFFRYQASPNLELTVGSFDHPELLEPAHHYGIESQVPWHIIGDALPRAATTADSPYLQGAKSYQSQIFSEKK
jgi:hypothetical protein